MGAIFEISPPLVEAGAQPPNLPCSAAPNIGATYRWESRVNRWSVEHCATAHLISTRSPHFIWTECAV